MSEKKVRFFLVIAAIGISIGLTYFSRDRPSNNERKPKTLSGFYNNVSDMGLVDLVELGTDKLYFDILNLVNGGSNFEYIDGAMYLSTTEEEPYDSVDIERIEKKSIFYIAYKSYNPDSEPLVVEVKRVADISTNKFVASVCYKSNDKDSKFKR